MSDATADQAGGRGEGLPAAAAREPGERRGRDRGREEARRLARRASMSEHRAASCARSRRWRGRSWAAWRWRWAGWCCSAASCRPRCCAASNDVVGNYLQTLGLDLRGAAGVRDVRGVDAVQRGARLRGAGGERAAGPVSHRARPARADARSGAARRRGATPTSVVDSEWRRDGVPRRAGGPGGGRADRWRRCGRPCTPPSRRGEPERSIYREVLKRLDDLSDARSSRLTSSQHQHPDRAADPALHGRGQHRRVDVSVRGGAASPSMP